ncbi:MAG: OB-fold nucleic acid binding domain-containing protein, partial [bacterium]
LLYKERQFDLFGPQEVNDSPQSDTNAGADQLMFLSCEKEAFGFYFSSHPLERYRVEYEALNLISTEQLEGLTDNSPVALGGVITARRMRKDKRDREYYIVTIEDFTSSVEVLVFVDLLESCRQLLTEENLVIVQGRVKLRASSEHSTSTGTPQIWAERIIDFASAAELIHSLNIKIDSQSFDDHTLSKIKDVLTEFCGKVPVALHLINPDGTKRSFRLKNFPVRIDTELLEALTEIVGDGNVQLKAAIPSFNQRYRLRNRRS